MDNSWDANAAKYKIFCGIHVQDVVFFIGVVQVVSVIIGFIKELIKAEEHWTYTLGIYLIEFSIVAALIYGIITERKAFVLIYLVFFASGIFAYSVLLVAALKKCSMINGWDRAICSPSIVWFFAIMFLFLECFFFWVIYRYYRFIGDKKNAVCQNAHRPDSQPLNVV